MGSSTGKDVIFESEFELEIITALEQALGAAQPQLAERFSELWYAGVPFKRRRATVEKPWRLQFPHKGLWLVLIRDMNGYVYAILDGGRKEHRSSASEVGVVHAICLPADQRFLRWSPEAVIAYIGSGQWRPPKPSADWRLWEVHVLPPRGTQIFTVLGGFIGCMGHC